MARKKTIKDALIEEEKDTKIKKEEEKETVEEIEEIDETEEIEDEDALDEDFDIDDDYEDEDYEVKKKEKKEKKTKNESKKKDKKDGYFAQVNKELKKVVWPSALEVAKYSLAVIIFCLVLCLFFVGVNLIASFIKGLF